MDKYERGKERVSWGTSCVFPFLFITFIYLREIHVPRVHTEVRGQPAETGSPFYHGLQGSNSGHQPWQQVPELLSYLGTSAGLLSWCLCASARTLPLCPSSSSRIHCLAMPSVKPTHFAVYFGFYGFQSCDFQRCEVLCLTSGFVSNALPTSSSSLYSTLHMGFTHVHSTLYMCYMHVYQIPSNYLRFGRLLRSPTAFFIFSVSSLLVTLAILMGFGIAWAFMINHMAKQHLL